MNKKIILIVGISILIVLTGCQGGFGFGRDNPITDEDVRVGTKGIIMEFLENAPPTKVFEGGGDNPSPFPIFLKLNNIGTFDIEDDKETTTKSEKGIISFGFEKAYVSVLGFFGEEVSRLSEKEKEILEDRGIDIEKIERIETLGEDFLTDDQKKEVERFVEEIEVLDKQLADLTNVVGTEIVKRRVRQIVDALEEISNEFEEFNNDVFKDVIKFADELINIRTNQEFEIDGKSIFIPGGDEIIINVNAYAGKIGVQSEKHTSTIFATACYPYKTIVGTSACIDANIIGDSRGEKACSVKDIILTGGQGAPVTVTRIESRMLPQGVDRVKPHFLIHIRNIGNGEVVNRSKLEEACSSASFGYQDFNTLEIHVKLSGISLKCGDEEDTGPATIRLRDKTDVVRCTYKEDDIDTSVDAYVAPLSIDLSYGYTHTISKNIIIEKILTY